MKRAEMNESEARCELKQLHFCCVGMGEQRGKQGNVCSTEAIFRFEYYERNAAEISRQ
jgi:hypothetical protein